MIYKAHQKITEILALKLTQIIDLFSHHFFKNQSEEISSGSLHLSSSASLGVSVNLVTRKCPSLRAQAGKLVLIDMYVQTTLAFTTAV